MFAITDLQIQSDRMKNNEGKGKPRGAQVCYLSKNTSTKPSLQLCTRRQTGML